MKKTLLPVALLLAFVCTVSAQALLPRAGIVASQPSAPPSSTSLSQVWSPKAVGLLPANYNVADICIVSEQVIWAVAFDYHLLPGPIPASFVPKLLKSTDGGETWTVKDISAAQGRISWDIHAFDENSACIVSQDLDSGPGRGIFRTTDGGETWIEVFHHVAGGAIVHFFDAQEGVCWNWGWGSKAIARTTDGGATWTLVSAANVPTPMSDEGHTFSSASNAFGNVGDKIWFGTTKGRILKTEDRGETWTATNTGLGSQSAFSSMGFMDEKNGLAVSWLQNPSTYEIVQTTDGGLNWEHTGNFGFFEVDAIPCSKTFMAVTYWTDQRTSISSDLGETWTEVDSTIDAAAAVFHTPELGWMVEAAQIGVGTGPALYKWIGDPPYGRTYVNQNATGANNGRGWADAYTDLQAALAAAQAGDEIWVAEGTYKPAAAGGSQTATFLINKDLKLYGGFAGTECNLSERDVVLYPTILSGDLNGDDIDSNFTQNRGDNVLHVVRVSASVTEAATFDGFIVRGGHADGTSAFDRDGGGLTCSGRPGIRNCVFEQNFANRVGGGARLSNIPNPGILVENCRFEGNQANLGGGLWVLSSTYTVSDCSFSGNRADFGNLQHRGGGAYLEDSRGAFSNCIFNNNIVAAGGAGGGVMDWSAPTFNEASFSLLNCHFLKNTAEDGGGVAITSQGDNAQYLLTGCDFIENEAILRGGGAGIFINPGADNSEIEVAGCHFISNKTGADGSGLDLPTAGKNMTFNLKNCLFEANSSENGYGTVYVVGEGGATGAVTVDSCRFENNANLYSGALEMGNFQNGTDVGYHVTNSVFKNNHATIEGGAITCLSSVNAKGNFLLENCQIDSNAAEVKGGGIVFIPSSKDYHATVSRCRIADNHSEADGGAIAAFQFYPNVPLPTTASVLFENCLVTGNTSPTAIVSADSLPNLQFLNCTIAGNTGGGIQLSDKSGLTLQNTILYNPGYTEYQALTNDVTFTSHGGNLIGDGSLAGQATPWDFQNTDPLFVAPGDFHLAAASPAIDNGVDFGNLSATDLDGNPRVIGCPDIGAFENAVVVSTDCVVGTGEAAAGASSMTISPNPASDFLQIQVNDHEKWDISLFDLRGRQMFRQVVSGSQTIGLKDWPTGIYALRAVSGERVFSGKIVKQ